MEWVMICERALPGGTIGINGESFILFICAMFLSDADIIFKVK
jgi:hypothetical protein